MAVESPFSYLDDLNITWPDGAVDHGDTLDNHIRGLKTVMLAHFYGDATNTYIRVNGIPVGDVTAGGVKLTALAGQGCLLDLNNTDLVGGVAGRFAVYVDNTDNSVNMRSYEKGGKISLRRTSPGGASQDCLVVETTGHTRLRSPSTGQERLTGTGSPEGVVTANPGSDYLNSNGGVGTTYYVKRSGTGNTGWFAVA